MQIFCHSDTVFSPEVLMLTRASNACTEAESRLSSSQLGHIVDF